MPDITMCLGHDCKLKKTCYRYTAEPDKYYQSYFMCSPVKNGKCKDYWSVITKKQAKKFVKVANQ